jgi:hypothetical protein
LLVALLSVRVLLLSAKQLFLAAKQLFLAAKHAVACMSQPAQGRFQRELSARQPGYTLWTVIRWAIMASCRNGLACRYRALPAIAWRATANRAGLGA